MTKVPIYKPSQDVVN